VRTRIFDGYELAGNAAFAEAWTDKYACHAFQGFCHILVSQLFTVHEVYRYLAVIVGSCL